MSGPAIDEDVPSRLDHVQIKVSDPEKSKAFYLSALAPLGYKLLMEFPEAGMFGFGVGSKPDFWLGSGSPKTTGLHLAFNAASHAVVDEWYAAALAAGAQDNGGPGIRAHYHAHYYGAFVLDPDGNNIEAVCHAPQPTTTS